VRIAKVKIKEGLVTIVETAGLGTADESETTRKIYADPHPDFRKTMEDLEPHVRGILGWPSSYAENRIRISGVSFSFSEKTGVEGAVMSGLVDLDASDSPFSFNTPHLAFAPYCETGSGKLMPDDAIDALEALRAEALAFLKGKRAQADLFDAPGRTVDSDVANIKDVVRLIHGSAPAE